MIETDYSSTYDPDLDFDRYYTLATARRIVEHLRPADRVLELGCATGLMSATLCAHLVDGTLTGVDRSESFLQRARERGLAAAHFVHGDLDDLPDLGGGYDHVIATNVLHELADPQAFLLRCAMLSAPDGIVHVSLQNPSSIHRLVALELGMIDSLEEISDRGAQWGTRGMWSAEALTELAASVGLVTCRVEGILLKPLPNRVMAELPEHVIEGFIRVARHLPTVCSMNYLALRHG